ncbi:MAG: trypsin-like serine protease [Myxococcales bacterium]|nr:trypsin-like serine protease [Myxococcales bacterium]
MRVALLAAMVLAVPAASAAPGDEPTSPRTTGVATSVIGGADVPAGQWRDVAAVLFGNQQGCTGVLIAPSVVMTADHCRDPDLNAVLIGTNSLARPSAGELIDVVEQIPGPGAYDVALLILARPSKMPVRLLATGWVQREIVDGAPVALVGYGAIDRDAMRFVDELRAAESTVTDADCSRSAGCDAATRPAGELGAGGGGVDTCPGDSGGPMYLRSPHGAFLAGITSRGYASNQFDCSEGGIYTRPDKAELVAWVEQAIGTELEDGLHPLGEPMRLTYGATRAQRLDPNDPYATAHAWTIVTPPARGTATLADDGTLTITAPPAEEDADDSVLIRATDVADPTRAARVRIALAYRATETDDGGCCSTGSGGGGGPTALATLLVAVITRRRRSCP